MAALLLASSGAIALAKPAFETGPYLGSVAIKGKPPVTFTATRKRVKQLEIGSLRATCSDGRPGTINLPGTPAKRSLKLTRGRFQLQVKQSGEYPEYAGTRVTGKLKGRKASGTVRLVLRKGSPTDPDVAVCDTGPRRWRARPEELLVELP